MSSEPTSITRSALEQRIRSEVTNLEGDDLAWWVAHRVEPFILPRFGLSPHAVAKSGEITLVFFDDRDAFGRYVAEPWKDSLILYRDLAEAVRYLATDESASHLFVEMVSELLRLGIFERGDLRTQRRVLSVLRAFGPDAVAAVPKLIEITSREKPIDGLKELAVATLSDIGPGAAQAVPRLIEMAVLDTANARAWCLQAFESIGSAAAPAVPLLIDLLLSRASVDPDPIYVSMAADALGNIGAIEALPALIQVLRETDDPDVAASVAQAIGKFGPEAAEAGPLLAALVGEHPEADRFPDDAHVRAFACEALRRIGNPRPPQPSGPD